MRGQFSALARGVLHCTGLNIIVLQDKPISAVLHSADRVIVSDSFLVVFALNFLAPHGFPRIPLFTGPSCCISPCTTRSQARKCGQLFPSCHGAPQPCQRAAAQINNNRGSFSKFIVSNRTSLLTLFFFGFVFSALSPLRLSQSVRGVKTLDFAGSQEEVYERSDWPLAKLQDYFKNDTLALIGYGSQGHGQGLNARDNGLNVVVGVRENGESWKQALEDGWVRARDVSLSPPHSNVLTLSFLFSLHFVVHFD
jgi:hypothetical protein